MPLRARLTLWFGALIIRRQEAPMPEIIDLPAVDRVEITTLCENLVDSQVPRSASVERLRPGPSNKIVSTLFVEDGPQPFAGAHGLAMLVRLTRNGVTRSVLFDAGGSPDGLTHNLDSLGLSPK